MGPPPRTSTHVDTFEFDVNSDFYFCENCATHMAKLSYLQGEYVGPDNNKHYLLLQDLINAVPDADHVFSNTQTIVRSAYCKKCDADFGFKFIELATPKDEIQAGRFIVFADKFQIWKGKKVLDAVTEKPAEKFLGVDIRELASMIFPDGANAEPVEEKTPAEIAEELHRKTVQVLRMTEQLKLLSGGTKFQVEKISPDDEVTEDPVEKNMPEAATEDPVEKNTPEEASEDPVDWN